MKNRGDWEVYVPNEIPEGMPDNAIYWRRIPDGIDFYEWMVSFYGIKNGVDSTGTQKVVVSGNRVVCVCHDVSMLALTENFTLFEMEEDETTPDRGMILVDGVFLREEVNAVTVVNSVDLWSRLTDEEADQVGTAMEGQSFRVRKIFESASSFRSDHELWPLLRQITETLFGAERASEILAQSSSA